MRTVECAGVRHFVWSALEDVRLTPGEAGTLCACSNIAQFAAMSSAIAVPLS